MISADALEVRLDTRAAVDICRDAIAALATALPSWVPRNAALEVILMEALATEVEQVLVGSDAILGGLVEQVLELFGMARLPGAPATGVVRLTFSTLTLTTVPAGTVFTLPDQGVDLVCTADTTPVTSVLVLDVPVATAESTSAVNGLASAPVDVLDVIPNVNAAAVTSTPLTGGYGPETDQEYLARATSRLARVTSSLVVPDHFAAYALEDGRPINAACIPAWDYSGSPGAVPGHVSVATYGRGGNLDAGVLADLQAIMQAMTAAGITVHVGAASLVAVAVTVTVHPLTGWSSTDVRAAVTAALNAYLDPATWTFGDTVRTTTLISVIAAADGVDYVTTLAAPASDTTLLVYQLASPGTYTITVA